MNSKTRNSLISLIGAKGELRSIIQKNAKACFDELEVVLNNIVSNYNSKLKDSKAHLSVERPSERIYKLIVDDDTLIFSLQSGVCAFDREHDAWKTQYVVENNARVYVGVINVYDFLTDTFKYEREEDAGYMIARIFVNMDNHFFVEGKRQRGMGVANFGTLEMSRDNMLKIVETAVKYAVEFDALVPPYEQVMLSDYAHMYLEIEKSKTCSSKRLGFQFRADDVK
ncbi:MAG: hypothetical protein HUJ96_08955 [Marinilabiliaceae bacterium]|nr:hypothetical protein [Marinilabiliaceae bacterium]